jgi:hypothetical protein
VGAYALAWSVGFVLVIFPSGVGPRELALIAALAPVLPRGSALVVAIVSRLVMTVCDLAWAGIGFAVGRAGAAPPGATAGAPTAAPRGAAPPATATPGGMAPNSEPASAAPSGAAPSGAVPPSAAPPSTPASAAPSPRSRPRS